MNRMRSWLYRSGRALVYGIGLFITTFIIASSYETASNNDVPMLSAVQRANLTTIAPTLTAQTPTELLDEKRQGNFGLPETMRLIIDGKATKILVAPGLRNNNRWLARANTSHVLMTTAPKAGNAGDMVIYMKQSWRTIASPSSIAKDTNIFIDTNKNWRYMFRVASNQSVAGDVQTLIPDAKDTQLTVIIEDPTSSQTTVIRGTYVSVLNVGQM